MKFILDANLPPSAARWLKGRGHEAWHLLELSLDAAEDEAIWDEALRRGAVIITKDQDFVELARTRRPAAQIVWLRTGNMLKRHQIDHLSRVWLKVLTQISEGVPIIEVR